MALLKPPQRRQSVRRVLGADRFGERVEVGRLSSRQGNVRQVGGIKRELHGERRSKEEHEPQTRADASTRRQRERGRASGDTQTANRDDDTGWYRSGGRRERLADVNRDERVLVGPISSDRVLVERAVEKLDRPGRLVRRAGQTAKVHADRAPRLDGPMHLDRITRRAVGRSCQGCARELDISLARVDATHPQADRVDEAERSAAPDRDHRNVERSKLLADLCDVSGRL